MRLGVSATSGGRQRGEGAQEAPAPMSLAGTGVLEGDGRAERMSAARGGDFKYGGDERGGERRVRREG